MYYHQRKRVQTGGAGTQPVPRHRPPLTLPPARKSPRRAAPITYTKAFSNTLVELGEKDKKLVAITAAMPEGTGLDVFGKYYPDRFFDVGIAEQHAVTMAAGLAANGYHPVTALYSTFAQRAFDQLLHDVAMQNLPFILCLDRAGLVGDDGATHHGNYDLSFVSLLPNFTVMVPKDENELRHMVKTAAAMKTPVMLRYPRGAGLGWIFRNPCTPCPLAKVSGWQKVRIWISGPWAPWWKLPGRPQQNWPSRAFPPGW